MTPGSPAHPTLPSPAQLWRSLRAGLAVVLLFAAAAWLARHHAASIRSALEAHAALGVAVFVATSALAVLLPMLSNLPLVPLAALAWGPAWTAALLLAGWVLGSAAAFALGRHARGAILHRFPSARHHADIDRLILPRHRIASLVLLRMTFPVDVLSYALGLFSRRTTLRECVLSTALGGAPFALLFAWVPVLPSGAQLLVFGGSALAFVAYFGWALRRADPSVP